MAGQSRHITRKVVMGYILLIIIAVCSISYIYNVVEQVVDENEPDNRSSQKVYLVTNTLSLLYESEALGQLVGVPENDFRHFNRTLSKAHQNMDSLRSLITDSLVLLKIDTIDNLLERKRWNTRSLLATWKETNTETLYTENIEKIIAIQDTVVQQVEVLKETEVSQDTVVIPRQRRGFFRRLADVFAPAKEDTSIVVNATHRTVTDSLANAFNPTDTIVSVLKGIQDSVAGQRKQLDDLLLARAANLRYNNSIITTRINQLLRSVEEEEVNRSLARMEKKQELLRETSRLIIGVAILSLILVLLFLFFIGRDISRSTYYRIQLEKAKQYAEDLLHSREKLMLTISHDIRAPLSSIIGYIELMLRLHPDERQRYYLDNMAASSQHILSLVNDLLDFHRLESGQMEIQQVAFSVSQLSEEIYASFKPQAEAKGVQFEFNLMPETSRCLYVSDPIRIRQVVGNLLSNAIKFTMEGRVLFTVSIESDAEGQSRLAVLVSDAGPGIPDAEQEKIFSEFTRLTSAGKEEGFGLGLSITRKLISLMGGSLSLYSVEGKGSNFTVTLPLYACSAQSLPIKNARQTDEEEPMVLADRNIYCLLVDDDPLQLALTEELLTRSHVSVVCCTNPHTVPELLGKTSFDIVITDIQMPGLDGYQLLKLIRNSCISRANTIPVIALSASIANEHGHYLEAGFTGFLNKPFTAGQLIALLNNLLTTNLQPATELNFSSLTAFAGEDKEASDSILRTFAEETKKSIDLLRQVLAEADREYAARLSHKLIPLFTMLGANTLVQQLRILEKDDEELSASGWEKLLSEVLVLATEIVDGVEKNLSDVE